jgi:FkbM family methyltransferase
MYDREKYILSDSPIKNDLLKLFSFKDKLVIFDIGGCEGEDSIRYSRLFPNSKIFIFEPLPNNQKLIQENLKKFKVLNVALIPEALSDNKSVEKFHVSSGCPDEMNHNLNWDFGNKSSSLLAPDKIEDLIPWLKFKEVIEVPTNTLKNFVQFNNLSHIDFVHMDVQGAELKVLKGAQNIIKYIRVIWLEVSNDQLYKEQPQIVDVESFMHENEFIRIKTIFSGVNSDQLYINKKYFKLISFMGYTKFFKIK